MPAGKASQEPDEAGKAASPSRPVNKADQGQQQPSDVQVDDKMKQHSGRSDEKERHRGESKERKRSSRHDKERRRKHSRDRHRSRDRSRDRDRDRDRRHKERKSRSDLVLHSKTSSVVVCCNAYIVGQQPAHDKLFGSHAIIACRVAGLTEAIVTVMKFKHVQLENFANTLPYQATSNSRKYTLRSNNIGMCSNLQAIPRKQQILESLLVQKRFWILNVVH